MHYAHWLSLLPDEQIVIHELHSTLPFSPRASAKERPLLIASFYT